MEKALRVEGKALQHQRKAKMLCIRLGKQLFVFSPLEREIEGKGKKSHPDGSNSEATEH